VISQVAVVVPAADEQDEIGACLEALQRARTALRRASGGTIRSRVIVVLDACRDATASIAASFADVETVVSTARCVGAARRIGSTHALGLTADAGDLWLASTDADCRVPEDWLIRMAAHADAGADVVLGTVQPEPGLTARAHAAWVAAHPISIGHPHVHAANLGIAARTYRELGGWHDLRCHEDVDLVARALALGARVVRSPDLPVGTSSRLHGRAPGGFAAYLSDLETSLSDAG
jgi:glycosyltransferase involved in cell wall biosynthesis